MTLVLESVPLSAQDHSDFEKFTHDLDERVHLHGRDLFSRQRTPDLLVQVLEGDTHTRTFSPQSFTPLARLTARAVRALDSLAAEKLEAKLEGIELKEFRRLRYGSLDEVALQTYAYNGFPQGVYLGSGVEGDPVPPTECGVYELLFTSFEYLFRRAQRFICMDDEYVSAPLEGPVQGATVARKKYSDALRLQEFTGLALMVGAAARYLAQHNMIGSYEPLLRSIRESVLTFYASDEGKHYRGDWDGILCNALVTTIGDVFGIKEDKK